MDRRVFLSAVLVVAGLGAGLAARPAGQSGAEAHVFIGIKDPAPATLTANGFRIWESGQARTVTAAAPATESPSVIVIVHGFGRQETGDARKALTGLVEAIRRDYPEARFDLIGDVKTPKLASITANAAKIDEAARRFALSGTNMVFFETIRDAAKALSNEPTHRRIIIALTNAKQHDGDTQMIKPTVEALKKSGASLWQVEITPEGSSTLENQHATIEMDAFVNNAPPYSGGHLERIFGTTALPGTLLAIESLIRGQYDVSYTTPAPKGESELRVGVSGVASEQILAPSWVVR
jgi:hypothetical protein